MTATQWTLAQTLQRHGLSAHTLIKVSGLSKDTVYDIVNGKSHRVAIETLDKLLLGLEQLTGQPMSIDAVLDRNEPEDPYANLFSEAKPYDPKEVHHLIPVRTPEEQAELNRSWDAMEEEKRVRQASGDRRMRELEAIFADEDGLDTNEDKSA